VILFGDRFLNIEDFTNLISLKIGFFWLFFWNTKVALTNKPHLTTFAKPLAQDQYQNAILELVDGHQSLTSGLCKCEQK
jgi:hypothetical protein